MQLRIGLVLSATGGRAASGVRAITGSSLIICSGMWVLTGFARTTASGILAMAFLFAVISSVGDILQITQGLPFAVVNILMAVILFIVLGRQPARSTGR